MCLSNVLYKDNVGIGFKVSLINKGLKADFYDITNFLDYNIWHEAKGDRIWSHYDNFYDAGFHIWTKARHAIDYGLLNISEYLDDLKLYLVQYSDILHIGLNECTSIKNKNGVHNYM